MRSLQQYIDKAAVLVEALPYIQSFRDRIVVVKYGGSTMGSRAGERADTVLRDIVFMEHVGMNPVIVHGGGKAIDDRLREAGVETRRINGLRVTDEATMRVVEETLFGEVNGGIVGEIEALGGKAVGVSAKDAGVMSVSKHFAETDGGKVDIGFVGDVDHIEPKPLFDHIERGQIPVVAPIGRGENGESYNVNAAPAAGELAAALHAEKLVFLTDVRGVMTDPRDADSLLSTVHVDEVWDLIARDIIKGGMIPKVEACVHSVKAGVRKTHVIDGTIPHSMLLEVFTDAGVGTQIVQ